MVEPRGSPSLLADQRWIESLSLSLSLSPARSDGDLDMIEVNEAMSGAGSRINRLLINTDGLG